MKDNTLTTPTNSLIDLCLKEIKDFESKGINLSNNVYFSQYSTVQDIKTHENRGFKKRWNKEGQDPRKHHSIIHPMIETAVSHSDVDTSNLEPYTDNHYGFLPEVIARSSLQQFHRQTNQGVKINEIIETLYAEGSIAARKVNNNAEIYELVNLANLYVIDQSAKTLEDTTVIEKQIFSQTQLKERVNSEKGEWANIDKVIKSCDLSKKDELPFYEAYYRYGEVSKDTLAFVKSQLYGTDYKENEDDKSDYVPALFVMVRAKTGQKDNQGMRLRGIPVFCEELKPEKIKISKHSPEIKKYKPYAEAHLTKYQGRWLRAGYVELGMPYEDIANSIGNRLLQIINHLKLIYHTTDAELAGKNIKSSFQDGQFIVARDLRVLNNQFPNLAILADEWNRNIENCRRVLKAYEVATGESTPSSASATAVATQAQAVGNYYSLKREKIGLFLSEIYKRWVLKTLLSFIDAKEQIEIIGDPSYIDEYLSYKAKRSLNQKLIEMAVKGNMVNLSDYEQLLEVEKENLIAKGKWFEDAEKIVKADIEMYVGINPTGEAFNKQGKITNSLKLLEMELNPAIAQNPEAMETINEIKKDLGLRVRPRPRKKEAIQPAPQPTGNINIPQVEQSNSNQILQNV